MSKVKSIFEKGYLPSWTEEEFFIDKINTKYTPTTYKVRDYSGNVIEGSFYRQEIQPVDRPDEIFLIDHIVRTKREGGKTWHLIHWRGYPKSMDSWVEDKDLIQVKKNRQRRY